MGNRDFALLVARSTSTPRQDRAQIASSGPRAGESQRCRSRRDRVRTDDHLPGPANAWMLRAMTTKPGDLVWYELLTSDPKAAIAFYGDVVGWNTQKWETGDYTMWVG